MLREKNAAGKLFTSHQVVRPKDHVTQSCATCHPESTAEELLYQIQAVQNYTRGKMRKSEAALGELIDTFAAAQKAGVPEPVLAEARKQHEIAHVLWEWWTAENSDGWHNPVLARESLTSSIAASQKGIELLKEAMKK
jgi:formate-dependent nitrite reductase cytochrome c552 subunit